MDCTRIAADDVAEQYLLGHLAEEDREAYESHFFECERCFGELRTLESLRSDLQRVTRIQGNQTGHDARIHADRTAHQTTMDGATGDARRRPRVWPLALAAGVIFGIGLAFWMAGPARDRSAVPLAEPAASQQAPPPAGPDHEALVAARIRDLARVEPPPYIPLTVRAQDDARIRFESAMDAYARSEYATAATGLETVASQEPSNARTRFFLGVSYLMLARPNEAVTVLEQCVALRDPAYQDDAQFFLAKALLRKGDRGAATRTLDALARSNGPRAEEARALRDALASVR